MTARHDAAWTAANLSRDPGFAGTVVHFDPTKWSPRRRNIMLHALDNGLTACGYETARFIRSLTQEYGGSVQFITSRYSGLPVDCIKDEEVDNLIAYTCAWIRLKFANAPHGRTGYYRLQEWLGTVTEGRRPDDIPAPEISARGKVDFFKQYLKDNSVDPHRKALALKIRRGEILSINIKIAQE